MLNGKLNTQVFMVFIVCMGRGKLLKPNKKKKKCCPVMTTKLHM